MSVVEESVPVNFQNRGVDQMAEDVDYAIRVGDYYVYHAGQLGLDTSRARVIELGPGVNFGPNLMLAGLGMSVAVADRFLAPWNPEYHPAFYRALADAWSGPGDAIRKVAEQGSYDGVLTLIPEPAEALTMVADDSVDCVLSNAVLEHVYDIDAVAREMARITKRGGVSSHQTDFRDHSNFDRPLEFLLEAEDSYAQARVADHMERGNRLRMSTVVKAFQNAGFDVVDEGVNDYAKDDYLADFTPRLRASGSPFADLDEAELRIIGARSVFRRT